MRAGNKYRAVRTNGYASKAEASRAAELAWLANSGKIVQLRKQVRYELIPKDGRDRAISYVADFVYMTLDGTTIVEDVKGFRTPVYKLKRRLMKWKFGIDIQEV